MAKTQSDNNRGWGNELTRFIPSMRQLVLCAFSLLFLFAQSPLNEARAELPQWLKDKLAAGKKNNTKTPTSECVADQTIGDTWLDEKSITKDFKARTLELWTSWETLLPNERFELPNATTAEKTRAADLKKEAFEEFDKFAKSLYALAQKVGVERSRKCQDCILINDWSYLGFLSIKGAEEFGLGKISTDAELTDPNGGASATKIKLDTVTDNGVRLVRADIANIKKFGALYKKSLDDDKYLTMAPTVCDPLNLSVYKNSDKCFDEVEKKCKASNYAQVDTYCTQSMILPKLTKSLGDIVTKLSSSSAVGGTAMKTFDHKLCKPASSGYFKHMKFRKFAIAN